MAIRPPQHEFSLMPSIGKVFVFPGQYTIYEGADVRQDHILSVDGHIIGNTVAIVVRKKPTREIRAV
ncbi:hypothetical protein MFUR16E_12760 [Methylobacterium fujisawaense]